MSDETKENLTIAAWWIAIILLGLPIMIALGIRTWTLVFRALLSDLL
jgi:hypothetical protein